MNAPLSIYDGVVVHRRLRPKEHLLRYKVFSLLIDLDRLTDISKSTRLLRVNKFGLLSFHERDHGDGRKQGLRVWVTERLVEAGIEEAASLTVEALCYPRIFGYVFNPLTVYFCKNIDGETVATLYQVNNTMGERHTYVIPLSQPTRHRYRQQCDKAMYVSPFTPMECAYEFNMVAPGDSVVVGIRQSDSEGPLLNASFVGARKPADDRALFQSWLRHPLMTAKVILGIHWEAFRLWQKRVPFFRHEKQRLGSVSVVTSAPREVGAD